MKEKNGENTTKENRTCILHVRLTKKEYNSFQTAFSKTTCRRFSDYARKKLLDKPVRVYTRNQSLDDFMAELISLRTELSAVGNNFNQAVKKLNAMQHHLEIKVWAYTYQAEKSLVTQKINDIKEKISKISELWLQ